MQFFARDGVVLHYQVFGGPEGKPALVFANSLGSDFRIWRDVVVALAGKFTILTYDKRGHGLSDTPAGPYTIDDETGDVAALMDHVGISKAIFCGLSIGGVIAQALSKARPDLIRALILTNTGHKIGATDMWNERIRQTETDGLEAMADGIMARWFTEDFRREQATAVAGYRNMFARIPAKGYAATCAVLRDFDFTEDCANIRVPVLCVTGDQDVVTPPALVEELAGLIPDAHFELIAQAGHIPCVEQPEAMSALILRFANEVIAAGEAS